MEQPFDDIDEIYNQKLGQVLNFFASKLQLYYSSSRLTLLLTSLDVPPDLFRLMPDFRADLIPLPPRLKTMDSDALSFFSVSHLSADWNIFRDFFDSGHPQALDGRKHATAASACLKIIFIYNQAPHSQPTPRVYRSQLHHADLKPKTLWHRSIRFLWHLRPSFSHQPDQKTPRRVEEFRQMIKAQHRRSRHLKFLLEKSAYSKSLLNFARRRVFRYGYLQQNHPIYVKTVIFALAKYIRRVTGETAEVRACESIWGRQGWFTAN